MGLILRLYVKGDVLGVVERLSRLLSAIERDGRWREPVPYWKVQGFYEVLAEFPGTGRNVSEFAQALGKGWLWYGKAEAVWNPGAESSFVEPLVSWAHLEMIE